MEKFSLAIDGLALAAVVAITPERKRRRSASLSHSTNLAAQIRHHLLEQK
jgi:hypothetical protein